jgi:hypothetical protein
MDNEKLGAGGKMDQKPNRFYIIWMLAGGYLLYLAYQMFVSRSSNPAGIIGYVFLVLFAVAGVGFIVKGIRMMCEKEGIYIPREWKSEGEQTEETEDEDVE